LKGSVRSLHVSPEKCAIQIESRVRKTKEKQTCLNE
jgi:hypothetical protein